MKQYLQDILDEKAGAAFYGGTLSWGNDNVVYALNVSGDGFMIKNGHEEPLRQTHEENYLLSKIYLKYKTPEHSFWNKAQENVKTYENLCRFREK